MSFSESEDTLTSVKPKCWDFFRWVDEVCMRLIQSTTRTHSLNETDIFINSLHDLPLADLHHNKCSLRFGNELCGWWIMELMWSTQFCHTGKALKKSTHVRKESKVDWSGKSKFHILSCLNPSCCLRNFMQFLFSVSYVNKISVRTIFCDFSYS